MTTAKGKRQKETEPKTNQKEKEKEKMPPTIDSNDYSYDDAEEFKLPSGGVHTGNLAGVEEVTSQKTGKLMTVLTVTLSPDDPDAPNLPMKKYLTWPVTGGKAEKLGLPDEKTIMWGSRTAWGAQMQAIKEVSIAFGGQESGDVKPSNVLAFLSSKIGMAVKVKVKQELRTDPVTKQPVEPNEMQASIDRLYPA